jgi:hypothetical protein
MTFLEFSNLKSDKKFHEKESNSQPVKLRSNPMNTNQNQRYLYPFLAGSHVFLVWFA